KEIEAALASYEQALALYRAVGDRLGEANIYMKQGDLWLGEEDWKQATPLYEQALALYQAVQDILGQANVWIDLGKAYFASGRREEGMQCVRAAAEGYARVGLADWAERAYRRLAGMLQECGRQEEARRILETLE
ncbi:MAG: tetratricopeptide repeat protein, partial [Anaerolineales bacterium]|nr:tetratricopeptide repeat protein [Anaerolineales bacterium]